MLIGRKLGSWPLQAQARARLMELRTVTRTARTRTKITAIQSRKVPGTWD